MRHLTLTEGLPPAPYGLTAAEADAIAAAELAEIVRLPGSERWEVAAGRKIGVATIGELQLTVRPKIPMNRLIFLMSYTRNPAYWRENTVILDPESDLANALAHAFGFHASKALDQGLIQGYVTVDDSLPLVRGRIRVGEQISRRYGRGLPLEVSYDEFTVDVVENKLLLGATLILLQLPGVTGAMRRMLQRLRLKLADVTPPAKGSEPPTWVASRLNARYQPALHLADLILAGDSFDQRVGDLRVTGFVFDMWKIYENFVCIALREAMRRHGGRAALQHRLYLDEDERVEMAPDFLWTPAVGPPVVVDAKYKAEKPSGFPQADLYQMLAYCTVLDVTDGHLIYAKGQELRAVHSVRNGGIRIRCHTLDLEQPPEGLLEQVSALASELTTVD